MTLLLLALGWAVGGRAYGQVELDRSAGSAGVGQYEVEQWGNVRASVTNRGPTDAEPIVVVEQAGLPVQQGRQAWVPAGATREVTVPIYPLEPERADERSIELQTRLVTPRRRCDRGE